MLRPLALSGLFLLLLPGHATAEWHFTPMVGMTFSGNTNLPDFEEGTSKAHRNFAGAVSLFGGGVLGVESILVWTTGFFESDEPLAELITSSRTVAFMGNVVFTAPRRWTEYNLRPYVSGGFGVLNVKTQEGADVLPFSMNMPAINIGGGAVGFFTNRTGVRFDVRYYDGFSADEDVLTLDGDRPHVRYMTASIGVVIRR